VGVEKEALRFLVPEVLLPLMKGDCPDGQGLEVCFDALPPGLLRRQEEDRDPRPDDCTTALEKGLYRLLRVRALSDYRKDYQRQCFEVDVCLDEPSRMCETYRSHLRRYAVEHEVARYLPDAVGKDWAATAVACGERLVEYVYATVAKRRRRAVGQVLQAARDAARQPSAGEREARFRQQVLAYLEESEFTRPVAGLAQAVRPEEWFGLLGRLEGMDGVIKLLGACRRRLEEATDPAPGCEVGGSRGAAAARGGISDRESRGAVGGGAGEG
jgi:hypothetical protein